MPDRLFIIDGSAFAYRSYFAIRTGLSDSKGRPTNAVYGFTRVLLKTVREHKPSHLIVVFDAPGKTFRDDWYPAYKATRPPTPEDLIVQIPLMDKVVDAFGIPLLRVTGVEADDVMGTLARRAEQAGMECALVTGDKDLLQLVTPHVRVYDPSKGDDGLWYDEAAVKDRFGVPPERVIDALGLMGDSADNVPGVRGIGEKTARKLLEAYGSIEGVYEHIDEIKGSVRDKLAADHDNALLSRRLVTIVTDIDFSFDLESARIQEPDPARLVETFSELEFQSMLEGYLPQAGTEEHLQYVLVTDEAQLKAAIDEMRTAGEFAVDTETTSEDPMRATLVGISLSAQPQRAYYIPVGHAADSLTRYRDPDDLFSQEEVAVVPRALVIEAVRPLLEDESVRKAGHNIKYDLIVFERSGIRLRGISMDTMVASYLTDPSRLRHNLNEVSLQYLKRKTIPITDLIGTGSKAVTFDKVPVDRACEYACEDADLTGRLTGVFRPILRERALEPLFEEVELPLIGVLARMEMAGIAIDVKVFDRLQRQIAARLGALEKEIHDGAGGPFQINSPKQLQTILFEKLGLPPKRKTKTGFSTDVDVLEELASEHPLPAKILEYRTLEKLRGTYVEALPRLRHPETGRIHTSFNQAVAATGRLSSSDPNLQNIPVRTEIGREIREGFVPGQNDYRLISADYSQIELRILAHLSGDEGLLEAFRHNADIHAETAARVFGLTPDQVTPDMRRQAKAVNFGVVYGISAFGLAKNLGISNGEAARFIEQYFTRYPGVRRWLDDTIERARQDGYVTTLLNRRRYLPDLKSSDVNTRKGAERAATNTPVQGTAADVIKLAMVRLDAALRGTQARLLLQVHDELLVEAPATHSEAVAARMREIMENALSLDVPLRVDVGIGNNWAEVH